MDTTENPEVNIEQQIAAIEQTALRLERRASLYGWLALLAVICSVGAVLIAAKLSTHTHAQPNVVTFSLGAATTTLSPDGIVIRSFGGSEHEQTTTIDVEGVVLDAPGGRVEVTPEHIRIVRGTASTEITAETISIRGEGGPGIQLSATPDGTARLVVGKASLVSTDSYSALELIGDEGASIRLVASEKSAPRVEVTNDGETRDLASRQ